MCESCHVTTVDCPEGFNNLDAVERMCQNLGAEFHRDQKTFGWWGKWVDDSPVPRPLFAEQSEYDRVLAMSSRDRSSYMDHLLGKCEHAIHFPGLSGEVGLVEVAGKLIPVWDWVSDLQGVLGRPVAEGWRDILIDEYEAARIELTAEQFGYSFTRNKLNNGDLEIVVNL